MAKAALNMMTRCSANDFARFRIFLNAVETGWITDNRPLKKKVFDSVLFFFRANFFFYIFYFKKRQWVPPLDEIDGAARILDPVFQGINNDLFLYGKFLKDYRSAPW